MAGGTFSATEQKVRPGLYMNFESAADQLIQGGARGVVAIPVKAPWGPVNQFTTITSEDELLKTYSAKEEGTALSMIKRILKGSGDYKPSQVLAYRIADSNVAKATITLDDTTATPVSVMTLDAKYEGSRGNDFKVTIQDNVSDSNKHDLLLYEGATLLKTFTAEKGTTQNYVDAINNDAENVWVTATKLADGNGTLAAVTGSALTGGDSGTGNITNTEYTDALTAFETQHFNVFVLDGMSDSALQASVRDWTIRLRSEGKKIQSVFGGTAADDSDSTVGNSRSQNFDHEGIINLITGVIDLDGNEISSADYAPWVAGLVAGTPINKSITYLPVPDVQDVNNRLTHSEIKAALQVGSLVLVHNGSRVVVEQGINTLTTLTAEKGASFQKVRVSRTLDAISDDITKTGNEQFIGKVDNDEDGRASFRAAVLNYFETLANSRAIKDDFSIVEDPDNPSTGDQAYFVWGATPIDSLEKIYNTVKIGG